MGKKNPFGSNYTSFQGWNSLWELGQLPGLKMWPMSGVADLQFKKTQQKQKASWSSSWKTRHTQRVCRWPAWGGGRPQGVCARLSRFYPRGRTGPSGQQHRPGSNQPYFLLPVYLVPNFSQFRVAWKALVQFLLQVHGRDCPKARAALSVAIPQVQKLGDCDEASVRPGIWLFLI